MISNKLLDVASQFFRNNFRIARKLRNRDEISFGTRDSRHLRSSRSRGGNSRYSGRGSVNRGRSGRDRNEGSNKYRSSRRSDRAVTVTETIAAGSEPEGGQTGTESGTAGDASAITWSDEAEGSKDISVAGQEQKQKDPKPASTLWLYGRA